MGTRFLHRKEDLFIDSCPDAFGATFAVSRRAVWTWDSDSEPRVSVPEGTLLVCDLENDLEIGVVVELGATGMAFEYLELGFCPAKGGSVDLVSQSHGPVREIPYEPICDLRLEEEFHFPVPIRRCIACFGPMDSVQRSALALLITTYS